MKNHMPLCFFCSVSALTNYACENNTGQTHGDVNYSSTSPEEITSSDQTIDIRPPDTPPPKENDLPNPAGPTAPILESEATTPPSMINGSYLRCFIEESNKAVKLEVGCRFQDINEGRILVSQLAKKAEYSLPRVLPATVSLAIEPLLDDPKYDVRFHLSGNTFTELRGVAYSAYYAVKLFELHDGVSEISLIDEGGSLMSELPKPWWQREIASDTNEDQLCAAGETCRFESSGLLWTHDNGLQYSQAAGASLCENLNDGFSDWRLPTTDELHVAYAKRIDAMKAGTLLNLRSAFYWTDTFTTLDQFSLVNIFTGEHSSGGGSSRAGVLCVRDLGEPGL